MQVVGMQTANHRLQQQRDRNGGAREQRAPRNDYGNSQYSQQPQQQGYGQMPMGGAAQAISALQGMSSTPQQAPAADSNAADPYAPYGGYQAYCAMCKLIECIICMDYTNHIFTTGYAALAQNGQGGQGQPQMPPQ